jgi:pimeloyl-ACP methyl ester carboxylesterase
MTTTASATRSAPVTAIHRLEVPGGGLVDVTVRERDRVQPFLVLHGGAGPASVARFCDLLAARRHARVIMPIHPGFDGTLRPATLAGAASLARVYAGLLDRLDVWDVTVIGNSIGGWIAAELALLDSPRVTGAILIDAVGIEVEGHPVTDVSGLSQQEIMALSFHDPGRFAPDPGAPRPAPDMVKANMAALAAYGGRSMTDPGRAQAPGIKPDVGHPQLPADPPRPNPIAAEHRCRQAVCRRVGPPDRQRGADLLLGGGAGPALVPRPHRLRRLGPRSRHLPGHRLPVPGCNDRSAR